MTAKDLRARPELIAMCQSDNFRVLLAYFMEECPYVGRDINDATSLIRNEGRMQGWHSLLREMRTIHIAPIEVKKSDAPVRKYEDPYERENPNQPKQ